MIRLRKLGVYRFALEEQSRVLLTAETQISLFTLSHSSIWLSALVEKLIALASCSPGGTSALVSGCKENNMVVHVYVARS